VNDAFWSGCEYAGELPLPEWRGLRIMMMPVVFNDPHTLPLPPIWHAYIGSLMNLRRAQPHAGQVGYLTIDERVVQAGQSHRRSGLHVDGVYGGPGAVPGDVGGWGGGPGPWGAGRWGMLTVASHRGLRIWPSQEFLGRPGPEGECEHLRDQCDPHLVVEPRSNSVMWLHGLCVHESLPQPYETRRTMVRLSFPSEAPWFEGYTPNPFGICPTGPILPRRAFMDS
jgi:hypothetical protein